MQTSPSRFRCVLGIYCCEDILPYMPMTLTLPLISKGSFKVGNFICASLALSRCKWNFFKWYLIIQSIKHFNTELQKWHEIFICTLESCEEFRSHYYIQINRNLIILLVLRETEAVRKNPTIYLLFMIILVIILGKWWALALFVLVFTTFLVFGIWKSLFSEHWSIMAHEWRWCHTGVLYCIILWES